MHTTAPASPALKCFFAAVIFLGAHSQMGAAQAQKKTPPQTLVSDFVMTRQIQALSQDVESRGTLYLGGTGQLRFEVKTPSPSVLVLNKGRASISYPQMDVTRSFDAKGDPVMQVLAEHLLALSTFDEVTIEKHYSVQKDKDSVRVLIPKSPAILEFFTKMRVKILGSRTVDWVEMTSRNGDVTRIAFANQRFGDKLDAHLFAVD